MTPIEQMAKEHGEETFSAISKNENGDVVSPLTFVLLATVSVCKRKGIRNTF